MANLILRSGKDSPLTWEEMDGNFEYFTGSINAINDATGSFLTSADTGSFLTSAQTASLNISDAKYTVSTALSASGSTQSTTSVCSYGVNVFEYVTLSNIAAKLPQPVTGKSVRVINNGNTLLKMYPSNVGGQINNLPINEPAIIPPDGNLYEFICIKNPLPGAWTFSTPAIGQYDSGEITISVDLADSPVITAINSEKYSSIYTFSGGTVNSNAKNKPTQILPFGYVQGEYNPNQYAVGAYFRPDISWNGISKIKVYTNLIQAYDEYEEEINMGGNVRILACGRYEYYDPADTSYPIGDGGAIATAIFDFHTNKTIAGTPTTSSTPYTSANIGDPGTLWGEIIKSETTGSLYAGTDMGSIGAAGEFEGTLIGNKSFGLIEYPNNDPQYIGTMVEKLYSSYISFQMNVVPYVNTGTIPDLKLRFVIEYY
jgi:hypothetical protein